VSHSPDRLKPANQSITGISDHVLDIVANVRLTIGICIRVVPVAFTENESMTAGLPYEIIVGTDTLTKFSPVVFDFDKMELQVAGKATRFGSKGSRQIGFLRPGSTILSLWNLSPRL
jgi:hypothetical protein